MAISKQLMGAGFSAGQANAVGGSVNANVTAAGTAQGDATLLTAAVNNIGTAASSTGVRLPQGQPGDELVILNSGAQTVAVYPPTGAKINAGTTNSALNVVAGAAILVKQVSATLFISVLTA